MAHEEHKKKVSEMRGQYGYDATFLRQLPEKAKHITPSVKSGTEVLAYVQKMWRRAIIHVPKSDKGEEFRDFYTIIYSQRSGNVSTSRATPKKGKTVLTVSFDPTHTRFDPHNHTKWSRKGLVRAETYEDGTKVWADSGIYVLPKKGPTWYRLMV